MSTPSAFEEITLSSPSAPRLRVHVVPYGLTIHRIVVDDAHDVIVGPEDPRDHERRGRCFLNQLVGRFANRLPSGASTAATSSDVDLQVDLPEWGGQGVCHHGGPEATQKSEFTVPSTLAPQAGPFDRLVWKLLSPSEVTLFEGGDAGSDADRSQRVFAIISPAGDNGFPGELLVESKVSIEKSTTAAAGTVRAEYRAKILHHSAPATPLNLTHHWGFNLSASAGKDQGRIDEHKLQIAGSPKRLDLDERGVPTGKLIDCPDGEPHGWAKGRRIGDALPQGGYDHFYTWGPADESDPRTTLESPATGLKLSFKTNQTGVQFYSANGQPTAPADPHASGGTRKLLHRGGDAQDKAGNAQRSAAFLEFGHPHAAFLHKNLQEFIGGEDTILRDGQVYRNWVEVEITA